MLSQCFARDVPVLCGAALVLHDAVRGMSKCFVMLCEVHTGRFRFQDFEIREAHRGGETCAVESYVRKREHHESIKIA
jgi:hypothetical protein